MSQYDPNQTTVPSQDVSPEDTMTWVGTDKARAKQVLDQENASGKPRSSLIEKLKSLVH